MKGHGRRMLAIAVLTLALAAHVGSAAGSPITLNDRNTGVTIDPYAATGVSSWTVDGTNQMFQQSFWYRVGSTGAERPINTLSLVGWFASDTNFDPGDDTLTVLYESLAPRFQIEVKYLIHGGTPGSKVSQASEQIRIDNTGSTPLTLQFFQYSDLDLGGDAGDDSAVRSNANAISQQDADTVFAETVATPGPNQFALGLDSGILASLNDSVATTLANAMNAAGPGNVSWAWQWSFTIAPDSSALISEEQLIAAVSVPNPASLVLVGAGILAAAGAACGRACRARPSQGRRDRSVEYAG
jgi:hypothetical protein